ncbi:MAG: threonine/serine exporter family protein [Acidaminococcaceae bacterium]|jgi:uncharacterized membrane protein YjjB (DUF3815 family)|nr:threonine/serine exporter family protein [Acidaminococcaceae bacterium]MCI2110641.1 threonine/serine exporter family protein [Acidaminococcaceae bacterium]
MLIKIFAAFVATLAFAVLFNSPRKIIFQAGIVGAVGFAIYIYLMETLELSSMTSNFAGTVGLSVCSEIFARRYKEPVTVFSVPGFLPLVPGLPLYRAMNYFILNDFVMGMQTFLETCIDAAAIAMGILCVSGLAKVYKTSKYMVEEHKNEGERK